MDRRRSRSPCLTVERALAAGAGLEVEADEQQVEVRVAAREADGVGELCDLKVGRGPGGGCGRDEAW